MARPPAPYSSCWKSFSIGKDKLAATALGPASTKDSNIFISAPAVSRLSTSAPPVAPIVASSPAPALAITAPSSDNKLFKQFMKAYLEAQVPAQIAFEIDPESWKQSFKARFPDLYYSNLHIDYYQFCEQCKDHFEISGVKKPNKILYSALFLRVLVTQRWLQHKRRRNRAVLMTWSEFKEFLRKNLGNSRAFVDSV